MALPLVTVAVACVPPMLEPRQRPRPALGTCANMTLQWGLIRRCRLQSGRAEQHGCWSHAAMALALRSR